MQWQGVDETPDTPTESCGMARGTRVSALGRGGGRGSWLAGRQADWLTSSTHEGNQAVTTEEEEEEQEQEEDEEDEEEGRGS